MAFLKGWIAEQAIANVQRFTLDCRDYHCFSDLLVKINIRYTQIDHVIVSKHGIFVVETKNRAGWIYGGPEDRFWTQVVFNTKARFQNPLRQNYLHTRSIAEFCGIDHGKIHSVIVFWGDCQFKTRMPENVVKARNYVRYIKSKRQILLSDAEVASVCSRLSTLTGGVPILTSVLHAQKIKNQRNRHDICPRCGGRLLVRTSRRGNAPGRRFIGCVSYPKCRFVRWL